MITKIKTILYEGIKINFKNDDFKNWLLESNSDLKNVVDLIPKKDKECLILLKTFFNKEFVKLSDLEEFNNFLSNIEEKENVPIVFSKDLFNNSRTSLLEDFSNIYDYPIFFEDSKLYFCSLKLDSFFGEDLKKIQDKYHIKNWLNVEKINNLKFQEGRESIDIYKKHIEDFYNYCDENDEERVFLIKEKLLSGEELWPIYVEKDCPNNFILEGRHKIIAAFECGFKDIKVSRVSTAPQIKKKLRF